MKIGTKSVLFGAHCWFIHPFFVAAAWRKLYGPVRDYRLYLAFFLHDLGYVGKPNMDGPEGETHVEWGAEVMHQLFDNPYKCCVKCLEKGADPDRCPWVWSWPVCKECRASRTYYRDFCLYHSRFYAKAYGAQPSPLCAADKLAGAMEPWWLYLPRVWATGELHEYMSIMGVKEGSKYNREPELSVVDSFSALGRVAVDEAQPFFLRALCWHRRLCLYMSSYAYEHADGRADTWTPEVKRDAD